MCTDDSTTPGMALADKITAQADGSRTAEAAAIIVTEAINGRLLGNVPLAWEDEHMAEPDWSSDQIGYLSGGERRLFAVAASLAAGEPVDPSDTLTGLDNSNSRVVLTAIAHALGCKLRSPGGQP